jgi:hypothetical protein
MHELPPLQQTSSELPQLIEPPDPSFLVSQDAEGNFIQEPSSEDSEETPPPIVNGYIVDTAHVFICCGESAEDYVQMARDSFVDHLNEGKFNVCLYNMLSPEDKAALAPWAQGIENL